MLLFRSASAPALKAAAAAVRRHMLWAALFSALLNLLFIAPTLYMLQIYDRVVPTSGRTTLIFLTLVLLFALATLSLLDFIRTRLLVRASVRLDRQLAGVILDSTLRSTGGVRETMAKQALREFDLLRQTMTGPGILAIFDAPWTPIYILVCLLIHPALGALGLVGAGVVLLIAWRNEKDTQEPLRRANEAANRSYVSQEQSTVGAEVIRALGMREAMIQRHLRERDSMMGLQASASFAAGRYMSLTKFVRLTLQSLALGLGALLAIAGSISPGAIFAAAFLLGRALAPIDQLVGSWRGVAQSRSALVTLDELLGSTPADVSLTRLPPPRGRLDVERLYVLAPGRDSAILSDVSMRMSPGEVVAVIGPSGTGKSTLARAIAGGIAADRGSVRFDGAERSDLDQDLLARHIGYLPQDPSLFAGTIKENIARFRTADGETAADIDSAVVRAAQLCGAHDMILRLPGGYDTLLGWGGRGLSAGQAQRVALARAIFGEPKLLILDEPNAHLDGEGENNLVAAIQQLKQQGAAVLVVAHRAGILAAVDKVMVLNNGRVELFGPRDEVMSRVRGLSAPPAGVVKSA